VEERRWPKRSSRSGGGSEEPCLAMSRSSMLESLCAMREQFLWYRVFSFDLRWLDRYAVEGHFK
jgi:hypothetical protein